MNNQDYQPLEPLPAELKEAPVTYHASEPEGVFELRTPEDRGWEEFREQCRRQMQRPMALRLKYGFAHRKRGETGEDVCRAFDTMEQYRAWCEANYPSYFGMKRPSP